MSPTPAKKRRRAAAQKGERAAKRRTLRESASAVYQDAILAAAERVFGRHGPEAARMTEIAAEAGMAAGTLYHYFDSKEEILRSLMERRLTDFFARTERAVAAERDLRARLVAIAETNLGFIEEHVGMFLAMSQMNGPAEWNIRRICGEEGRALMDRFLALVERVLADAQTHAEVRRDVPLTDAVAYFTGMMQGYTRRWVMQEDRPPRGPAAARLVDAYLLGLGVSR